MFPYKDNGFGGCSRERARYTGLFPQQKQFTWVSHPSEKVLYMYVSPFVSRDPGSTNLVLLRFRWQDAFRKNNLVPD